MINNQEEPRPRVMSIQNTVNPKPQLELNEWHEYIKKEAEILALSKKN